MRKILLKTSVNIARFVLGFTFLLSGFVKAIDPLGTQYKLHDYLEAVGGVAYIHDNLLLVSAVVLSTLEIAMGVMLLLAIARRLVARMVLLFMVAMTLITIWIYLYNPVKDCGCFGDAFVLTNGETLLKNVVLLACSILVALFPLQIKRFLKWGNQVFFVQLAVGVSIVLSLWCLYDLPLIDFRPYHVGADIKAGMEIPADAEQPVFDTKFILEKDGIRKEFTLDDYPDSTWTFIDSKTVVVKEGYVPPIHEFSIVDDAGDDITSDVLDDNKYCFLLVAPYLDKADDQNFGTIDQIYEYAQDNSLKFLCLTSSNDEDIERWKELTGAEYPFCQTDATTLKTVIRSNPGLVLLHRGVIVDKWSHNRLPDCLQLDKIIKQ